MVGPTKAPHRLPSAYALASERLPSEQCSQPRPALYAPSLYGHYGEMRLQLDLARREGVHIVLIAPMLCGVATLVALKREFDDMMFIAHPSLAGLPIAPAALLGKLFRLFGADAVIFPNHGGRFSFSRDACRAIARCNTQPWHDLKPALPTPAGGMSVERSAEMVAEYGHDSMLLIGGALLAAREQLGGAQRRVCQRGCSRSGRRVVAA